MKLAEALQERADLNVRIAQLRRRLDNNALVQEGEKPAEDPMELLAEHDSCIARLNELVAQINLTNCRTVVNEKTLTEHLAHRDALMLKIKTYRDFIGSASGTAYRATHSEIKIYSSVNVRSLQLACDAMAKELRELDNLIQQTNWTTDL